jgi:hypothetical protein
VKEGDDPNGQNDRTDLDRENQLRVVSSKLENQIWTRPADHHTGQRLLKMPQLQALQKTALDHSHTRIKTSCITGGNPRGSYSDLGVSAAHSAEKGPAMEPPEIWLVHTFGG